MVGAGGVTNSLPERFIDTALAAADAARLVTARYFRTALRITNKRDRSPVTVADRETEQRIKELILARHPQHSFFGEESGGGGENDAEWRWVIDPIDGTKAFATGSPLFGTLIALLHHGQPVLGIIDHGALDERWLGIRGRATTHNGAPCATSDTRRLADASMYATSVDMFADESQTQMQAQAQAQLLRRFNGLSAACRFRVFGGDCYCYGLLSRGFTEVVCEARLQAHDYLALIPVVEGAGGVLTDWRGNALTAQAPANGAVLASANRALHQAALAELQRLEVADG